MQPSQCRWPPVLQWPPRRSIRVEAALEHPRVVQGCQLRAGHLPLDRLLLVDIQHHHLRQPDMKISALAPMQPRTQASNTNKA